MEHELQRLQQRKIFEEQMRMLEHQQALEEQKLMGSPGIGGGPINPARSLIGGGAMQHHPAMSAPTTPPRTNSVLQPMSGSIHDNDIAAALSSHGLAPGSRLSNGSLFSGVNFGTPQSAFHSPANTTEKRKSVNYADYAEYTTYSPDASATHAHTVTMPSVSQFGSHTHAAGAKSMPGSRRGSGNRDDLAGINLQGLSIRDGNSTGSTQAGQAGILKNGAFGATAPKGFNPGFLLDEELDKELSRDMHSKLAPALPTVATNPSS